MIELFKGLKHTVACKCGETTIPCEGFDEVDQIESGSKKSDCCKSGFTYIGLQPYHENILVAPIRKVNPNLLMETVVEEEIIEEVDGTPTIVENNETIESPVEQKVEAPKVINEQSKESVSTGNGIPGLIETGPKGFVTNTQMIPVLKELIDNGKMNKVELLKNTYPDVYEKSSKYLPKKYQDKLK